MTILLDLYRKLTQRCKILSSYYFDRGYRAPYPYSIYININNICNLKCKMCDVGQKAEDSIFYRNLISSKNELLNFEEWKCFTDDVVGFRPDFFINGTEPLLYNDLGRFIRYADKNKLSCNLTTNGVLLEKWAEELVEGNLSNIFISLDGPPQIHDKIRGVTGAFDKAYAGIRKIIKVKKELNKKDPRVVIICTIMPDNYRHLEELIECFKGLDIQSFHFGHLDFKTNAMVELHNRQFKFYPATESCISGIDITGIDSGILVSEISRIKNRYKNVKFAYELNPAQIKKFYFQPEEFLASKCIIPWFSTQICADGTVISLDRCLNLKLGNIKEKKFSEIWNDKPYRNFRKIIKANKRFPICARCGGIFTNFKISIRNLLKYV